MKKADAIKWAGSVRNLAKLLKISLTAVYNWPAEVPPLRAFQIKELQAKRKGAQARRVSQ